MNLDGRLKLSIAGALVIALVAGVLIGRLSAPSANKARPASATPPSPNGPGDLYVQDAGNGTFIADSAHAGQWVLTLKGVSPSVTMFVDRPARTSRLITNQAMYDTLGFDKPGQAPPNAAITVQSLADNEDTLPVELETANYVDTAHTATYRVKLLDHLRDTSRIETNGRIAKQLPAKFTAVSLFIDAGGMTCAGSSRILESQGQIPWLTVQGPTNGSNDTWNPSPTAMLGVPGDFSEFVYWEDDGGFSRGCNDSITLADAAGDSVTMTQADPFSGSNSWNCATSGAWTCTLDPMSQTSGDSMNVVWDISLNSN